MRTDDLCTFCSKEREDIFHLLYQCEHAQSLWKQVEGYLVQNEIVHQGDIKCTEENVIKNSIHAKMTHVSNFVCLITKQYIYGQKCLNKHLVYKELEFKFRTIQNVEKYIAVQKGNSRKHEDKWNVIKC